VDRLELVRIVDRARIELVYARSAMRRFIPPLKPGDPDLADESIINSVGATISQINDTIRAAENLIEKLR